MEEIKTIGAEIAKEIEQERKIELAEVDQVVTVIRRLFKENNFESSKNKKSNGDGKSIKPARYAIIVDGKIHLLDKNFSEIQLADSNAHETKKLINEIGTWDAELKDTFFKKLEDEQELKKFIIEDSVGSKLPKSFAGESEKVLLVPACLSNQVISDNNWF